MREQAAASRNNAGKTIKRFDQIWRQLFCSKNWFGFRVFDFFERDNLAFGKARR
jgi:hypothetical protein